MILLHISFWSALILDLALGVTVYWANHKRASNQHFFILSLILATWLVCLKLGMTATTSWTASFWIRQASAVGIFIPTSFNFLRLAIVHRNKNWWTIIRLSQVWLLFNFAVVILCQTSFFLQKSIISLQTNLGYTVSEPVYGPGFLIYSIYFLLSSVQLVISQIRSIGETIGTVRNELYFTLLGSVGGILVGTCLALIIPLFFKTSQSTQFAPLGVVLVYAIVAYGIATRQIMDVAEILQRTLAYIVLLLYLIFLYTAVWLGVKHLIPEDMAEVFPYPHLAAALAVAFSMAPMHGQMQRFAKQLYIRAPMIDSVEIIRRANLIFQSISTLPELLKKFSTFISEVVGTHRVEIYLLEKSVYLQKYTDTLSDLPMFQLQLDDPLVIRLKNDQKPLVTDELERNRPTQESLVLNQRMQELKIAIAIGIQSRNHLSGVMLLGPRISGKIYSQREQDTLQLFCNQLATAIENAQLYTAAQDSKIYNEILLDDLVNGVVAVNTDGIIMVFNREAQRMTALDPTTIINHSINVLPQPVADLIRETLKTGQAVREIEAVLTCEGQDPMEGTPIRMGSSVFKGHSGGVLGVLVVLTDLSAVKKLERQVQRTDRLASIGTLSAGMAHEIKNPLVAIKTFTQLLPERYLDLEFRSGFSSLVGGEIDRIDSIVNQLLSFSRPIKPTLSPTNLHDVLNKSLRLIQHHLDQKGIALHQDFSASRAMIQADPHLLEQAFLNLFLNAIEAMNSGGQLHVSSAEHEGSPDKIKGQSSHREITILIRDTGHGIRPENISHVFDPFFTTKSTGTGLGLSVAHQIIQEHDGNIDVESELNKGTTFRLVLPLIEEEAVV